MYGTLKDIYETEMYHKKPMAYKFLKCFLWLKYGNLRFETCKYERLL